MERERSDSFIWIVLVGVLGLIALNSVTLKDELGGFMRDLDQSVDEYDSAVNEVMQDEEGMTSQEDKLVEADVVEVDYEPEDTTEGVSDAQREAEKELGIDFDDVEIIVF